MLVSDTADQALREAVEGDRRPCPEYLELERSHGVDLLDWSRLPGRPRGRSIGMSLRHVRAALPRLGSYDAVFSDGEHVGLPLALAMRLTGRTLPHLVLGHHVTSGPKPALFRALTTPASLTRLLLHSRRQLAAAETRLRLPASRLAFVPYFADDRFWRPQRVSEERLVLTAGREHRDYRTFATALAPLGVQAFVAAGSLHSPNAPWSMPETWPPGFVVRQVAHVELRDLYARAAVVVVPLLPTDFQAGITTILEAMAMGKAVVVSATVGQGDVVEDGATGLLVPPGDSDALREAVRLLLGSPVLRARLGRQARLAVERSYSVQVYARELTDHLREISREAVSRPA